MRIDLKRLQDIIKKSEKFKSRDSLYAILGRENGTYFAKLGDDHLQFVAKISKERLEYRDFGILSSLVSIISKIKKDTWIEFKEGEIVTQKRSVKFDKLKAFSTDNIEYDEKIKMTVDEFKDITVVKKSSAKDCTRPILQGMSFKNNKTCCLDGYRLSIREGSFMLSEEYVVPVDFIKSVLNSIGSFKGDITVEFMNRYVKFSFNGISISSNLFEGDFIHYDTLFPTEFKAEAKIDSLELLDEVEYISSVAKIINETDKLGMVKFFLGEEIVLSDATCKTRVEIEDGTYKGNSLLIAFNSRYLKDALQGVSGEITMNLNNKFDPCVIKSDSFNGLELVLPIRLI